MKQNKELQPNADSQAAIAPNPLLGAVKCEHGWHSGECCCNCAKQLKLMKHPWNKEFGKGSITEQCGWVCTMQFDDSSNKGEAVFYDFEHGMCEMYQRRK